LALCGGLRAGELEDDWEVEYPRDKNGVDIIGSVLSRSFQRGLGQYEGPTPCLDLKTNPQARKPKPKGSQSQREAKAKGKPKPKGSQSQREAKAKGDCFPNVFLSFLSLRRLALRFPLSRSLGFLSSSQRKGKVACSLRGKSPFEGIKRQGEHLQLHHPVRCAL